MLASASPLKPRVSMESRSSAFSILLVACLKNAVFISSEEIPHPLSVTLICSIPPPLISTVMADAPESIAFSTSSLATLTGLSTTSPAEILSIVSLFSILIIFSPERTVLIYLIPVFDLVLKPV